MEMNSKIEKLRAEYKDGINTFESMEQMGFDMSEYRKQIKDEADKTTKQLIDTTSSKEDKKLINEFRKEIGLESTKLTWVSSLWHDKKTKKRLATATVVVGIAVAGVMAFTNNKTKISGEAVNLTKINELVPAPEKEEIVPQEVVIEDNTPTYDPEPDHVDENGVYDSYGVAEDGSEILVNRNYQENTQENLQDYGGTGNGSDVDEVMEDQKPDTTAEMNQEEYNNGYYACYDQYNSGVASSALTVPAGNSASFNSGFEAGKQEILANEKKNQVNTVVPEESQNTVEENTQNQVDDQTQNTVEENTQDQVDDQKQNTVEENTQDQVDDQNEYDGIIFEEDVQLDPSYNEIMELYNNGKTR